MLKNRWNYWSCGKFAEWIRGEKKPLALTMEEWEAWRKELKKKSPYRYYFSEVLLNKIQNIVCWPSDVVNSIRAYIENRYITKTHYLKTGLEPGQYHELDDRILFGLFNELVDFIEVEQAWLYSLGNKEKKYIFKKGRCIEAGVDYLNWASELKYEEDCGIYKDDPNYGEPTRQALAAKKILELYNWWKNRPKRPDPMDLSGWSKYCEDNKSEDGIYPSFKKDEKKSEIFEKLEEIEEQYEKEDEAMLIDLIKIRKSLWT